MQNDRSPRTIVDKGFSGRREDWDDWSKEFLDAAAGRGDDDHSWAETLLLRVCPLRAQIATVRGDMTSREIPLESGGADATAAGWQAVSSVPMCNHTGPKHTHRTLCAALARGRDKNPTYMEKAEIRARHI